MKTPKRLLLYSLLIGSIFCIGRGVIAQSNKYKNTETIMLAQAESKKTQQLEDVDVDYIVSETWNDGYRVEVNVTGNSNTDSNWLGSIYLPEGHEIRENYGVLVSEGTSKVNFSGDKWNKRLKEGEVTNTVLIVDGNPTNEINIEFDEYRADLGEPTLSSFTTEERQQWEDDRIAEAEDSLTDTSNLEQKPETSSSETSQTATTKIENSDSSGDTATEEIPTAETAYSNFASSAGEGKFNYGQALQLNWLFFMANRSGEMGADNRLEWRSDSTLNDGADVGKDLSGGYFDAGDHIKFTQPMAYSVSFLAWSGIDYKEAYLQSGQFDELLNAVKQGTDYFLKSHESNGGRTQKLWVQVGDKTDHYYWVPPEQIENTTQRPSFAVTPDSPGSDVAAGTASALASASMLFAEEDPAYSQKLLENAIALYDFAETYLGKYSDSVQAVNPFYTSWSGYEDELVLGAMWLYRATGNAEYLTKAERHFKDGIGHIGTYTYVADDHSYAALALLAKESSDPFFQQEFQDWVEYWLTAQGGVKHSPGGLAIRAEWASAPLALSSSFLAEWYSDFVEPNGEYSAFAQKQLDYLLGDNPKQYSYLIGFGDNYPLRPHHRGSAGDKPLDGGVEPNKNLLLGALVGGPRSNDYDHQDKRDDWVTNEVGTGYNASLAATAIQQYDNHGGDPVPDEAISSAFAEVNDNVSDNIAFNDISKSSSETTDAETVPAATPTPEEKTLETSVDTNTPYVEDNNDNEISTPEEDVTISNHPNPGADAIAVGFENHSNGTPYSSSVQNKDWNATWSDEMDSYAKISNEQARSGSNSLQITYPNDRQSNKGAKWMLPPEKEYYMSYWVRFDDNFDFDGPTASGGKLPGLGQGQLCSGGQSCDGNNGFTTRYMWRENGQAVLYLYHMDKPSTYGEDIPLGRSFQKGTWHQLIQKVRVNDAGQNNGSIDIWMDGDKVLTRKNLRFNNGQEIDTAYFSTFHGGAGSDWWPDASVNAHFDDFVVTTNPKDVGL